VPALVTVTAAIDDLQNAENAAITRVKGAVVLRNEKRTALVMLLQQLKGYIQQQADANVENGASIIASAGVSVKKALVRTPRVFDAKLGPVSGSAKLIAASAGPRSSYEWQCSTDGGKTWVLAPGSSVHLAERAGGGILRRHRVHPSFLSRCTGAELNCRHADFQSAALPTELPVRAKSAPGGGTRP
jgi:hypothetical protein